MSDQEPDERDESAVGPSEPTALADLGQRFAARAIDTVLLLGVFVMLLPIPLFDTVLRIPTLSPFGPDSSARRLISNIVWAGIVVAYFAAMESLRGRTVGKMLVKIKVEGPDGGNPSLQMAIKRNIWYAFGVIPFIGDWALILVAVYIAATIGQSASNTGWHDAFAGGTQVVKSG